MIHSNKLILTKQYNLHTFEKVYKNYYNLLYRFAYHYVMSDDARDIVQEVFIELYENPKDLPTTEQLNSYLFTLTRNKCLNFLKHQNVIDKHESGIIDAIMSWNTNSSDDDMEIQSWITQCMELLSPQQQQILQLRLDGMSYSSIAALLNINAGTINTHVARAYKIIRDHFPEKYVQCHYFFIFF